MYKHPPNAISAYVDMRKKEHSNMILAPTGNLGIPRTAMPQIDMKNLEKFTTYLSMKDVQVSYLRVPALSLKMAQGIYNRDKVSSMISGGTLSTTPIFISSDNYVVDGNHRLIAQLNMPDKRSDYINVIELGLPILELLEIIKGCQYVRYRDYSDSGV